MPKKRSLKRPMRKANRRLKLMGLDPKIVIEAKEGWMIIPLEQIVNLIAKKIVYPHKEILLEEGKLVIRIWKPTTKPTKKDDTIEVIK